jgi:hypothetical protein
VGRITDGLILCGRCGELLPEQLFSKSSRKSNEGFQRWCNACLAEYRRRRYVPREVRVWPVKECFRCGESIPEREKYFAPRGVNKLSRTCRSCNRRWRDSF